MRASLQVLRTMQVAMLIATGLEIYLAEVVHHQRNPAPATFYVITIIAIVLVVVVFSIRKLVIKPTETALTADPANGKELNRLRQSYVMVFAFSEMLAIFGLMLRIIGYNITLVAPFYAIAVVLLLYFFPRSFSPPNPA